ncbi:MAG: translocation/assembly module TamB domain-containing protein, partial [Pseudomonadota bacterium]
LPTLRVDEIAVRRFALGEAVAGRASVIDLEASLRSAPDAVKAAIRLETDDEADLIDFNIDYNRPADRLDANAIVRGEKDGLFASVSGLDRPVSAALKGTGPASEWRGTLTAAVADLGGLEADLSARLTQGAQIGVNGRLRPGVAAPEPVRSYIGAEALIAANLELGGGKLALRIDQLETAAASAELSLFSEPKRPFVVGAPRQAMNGEGAITLGPEAPDGLSDIIGTALAWSVEAGLFAGGGLRIDNLHLTSDRLDARLADALYRPDGAVAAKLDLGLNAEAFGAPARLAAELEGAIDDLVTLTKLEGRYGEGVAVLDGTAEVRPQAGSVDAKLSLSATPDAARLLGEAARLSGPTQIDADVSLTPDTIAATIDAATPEIIVDQYRLDAGQWSVRAEGTPDQPQGALSAQFADQGAQTGLIEVTMTAPTTDELRLIVNDSAYRSVSAAGTAIVSRTQGLRSASLRAAVEDLTDFLTAEAKSTPPLTGGLTASLDAEPEDDDVKLLASLRSDALKAGELEAAGIDGRLEGLLSEFTLTTAAQSIAPPGLDPILEARLDASVATTGTEQRIELNGLSAVVLDETLTLISPTRVRMANGGVSLDATSLTWGETGRIDLSANLAGADAAIEAAWRDIVAAGLPFALSGDLAVDTANADAPGRLAVAVIPTRDDRVSARFDIAGLWDGERVALTGEAQVGDGAPARPFLSGTAPLRLVRGMDAISVQTNGELDFTLDYQGRLTELAGFAPEGVELAEGELTLSGRVVGPTEAPDWRGAVALAGGEVAYDEIGLRLVEIEANADATPTEDGVQAVLGFSAKDDRGADAGQIEATGDLQSRPDDTSVNAAITLDKARLANSDLVEAIASGDLALEGTLDDVSLTGRIEIDQLDASIPDSGGGPGDVETVRV